MDERSAFDFCPFRNDVQWYEAYWYGSAANRQRRRPSRRIIAMIVWALGATAN